MSRIPRFQENLKTGFTAEAVSAARCRAYAARAEHDGRPNLALRWRRLAAAKDALAVELLEAAEQVLGGDADLGTAIAEERYENEVLYPKIIREDAEGRARRLFERVIEAQRGHLRALAEVRAELNAAQGDVRLPSGEDEEKAAAAALAGAGARG